VEVEAEDPTEGLVRGGETVTGGWDVGAVEAVVRVVDRLHAAAR